MLNADALTQLRALKQQINDDRQRNTGTVKGSQGRFGFVVLDDGREIYLPAEQMQRVFPDDRVTVEVITTDDGKQSAVIETLIESPLRDFTGFYVVRDNAHFVEPDLPRLSRWIFLPPKQRLPIKPNANLVDSKRAPQHGDLVRARITRHPHNDGKPAARIEALIGAPDTAFIAVRYALARFGLPDGDLKYSAGDLQQPEMTQRVDLTTLPFVTIDNADTRDMDDALYAERCDNGWTLWVAIADPSAFVKPGSALEQAIAARANTVYLPGLTVAMLPDTLANEYCSLIEGAERPALVCILQISADGKISGFELCEARVRSQAKLNYEGVAAALADASVDMPARAHVQTLHEVATALRGHRGREHLLMPDRPDYRLRLDDKGLISSIERQQKTPANQLVEECMVAANRCAAEFLGDSNSGVFVCHSGFRAERREQIAQLLTTYLPEKALEKAAVDAGDLDAYIALIQTLDHMAQRDNAEIPPLRAIFSRWLERSRFSPSAAPHFGMGLKRYTTFTSPIRKYSDFLVHRAIKARLQDRKFAAVGAEQLTHMQEQLDRGRQAVQLAEQWLKCIYLQNSAALTHRGTIAHVNSSGFTVRLDDNGIEGFVDTRLLPEKYSFDANSLKLTTGARTYQLEQSVDVAVSAIDLKKRSINFQLVTSPSVNNEVVNNQVVDSEMTGADTGQ